MWQYKIVNSDLWFNIRREKEDVEEYYAGGERTPNKNHAKTFFHMVDAESALVIIRIKWNKAGGKTKETSKVEERVEKQSWSEFW